MGTGNADSRRKATSFLTSSEFARATGVTPRTLQRWVSKGHVAPGAKPLERGRRFWSKHGPMRAPSRGLLANRERGVSPHRTGLWKALKRFAFRLLQNSLPPDQQGADREREF